MLSLFENSNAPLGGVWKAPASDYIERTLIREIRRAKEYYRSRVFRVKSNHLLSRIITTISSSYEYDYQHFFDIMQDRTMDLSRHFQLTSPVSVGKLHDGVFFGEGNKELIIAINEDIDPYAVVRGWRRMAAVKVIDSGTTELNLVVPDGIRSTTSSGLYVVTVDMAVLALQYRAFQEELMAEYGEVVYDVTHFIYRHVLPNMLDSLVNTTLYTRFWARLTERPYDTNVRSLPTPMVNLDSRIDKMFDDIIKRLSTGQSTFPSMLAHLPSVNKANAYLELQLPDVVPTRQIWWALLLSRLRMVEALYTLSSEQNMRRNKGYVEEMFVDYKRLRNDKAMNNAVPMDILAWVNSVLDKVLEGRVKL